MTAPTETLEQRPEQTPELPDRVDGRPFISIVIPCLNEAASIERCVTEAWAVLDGNGLPGEVIVADNGSTDGSAELAEHAGARVVHERRRGYGSAYLAGFDAARGDYIVMADADLTYDFADIPRFVASSTAAPSSSWATEWTTSSPGRCRGTTATSATPCSPGC